MYTLYYLPGTCSLAVHVALNEINADFTLENVSVPDGQPRSEAYLKINPRGNVPALKEGDFVLREGAAILTYMLDNAKSDLLPQSGHDRARALEWLAFANSTLHPAYGRAFFVKRNAKEDLKHLAEVVASQIQKHWDSIEAQLSDQPYLCGKSPTIADILVTVIANWSPNLPAPITFGPRTKALFKSIIARPAYQKAMATEEVVYKVAA